MQHVAEIREVHTKFFVEYLKERDHYKDLVIYGRLILKSILKKQERMVWTGFIGIRTETNGQALVNTIAKFRAP
jgi:hypothetical protein